MSASVIRKFLRSITIAFDGKRLFNQIVDFWRDAIRVLRKKARSLSNYMKDLVLTRGSRKGREVALVGGRIEGGKFASLMRNAKSVEAFEDATASKLSILGKQAFRRVDDIAELHFPDLALTKRATYLGDVRSDLITRNIVKKNQLIKTADVLEDVVRKDAKLVKRANSMSKIIARTKKIVFLGVVVTAVGVGIAYLCREAAKHAAANSGCFMYINDNGTIRRCRASGCSCVIGSENTGVPDPIVGGDKNLVTCRDEDLWERMRLRYSECGNAAAEGKDKNERYCVHFDWNEIDPKSPNYVDKETLPENSYVRCEHQDALDAFNEMVGGTVDSIWDIVGSAGKSARQALASSTAILPWIIGIVSFIVILAIGIGLWRFFGKKQNDSYFAENDYIGDKNIVI